MTLRNRLSWMGWTILAMLAAGNVLAAEGVHAGEADKSPTATAVSQETPKSTATANQGGGSCPMIPPCPCTEPGDTQCGSQYKNMLMMMALQPAIQNSTTCQNMLNMMMAQPCPPPKKCESPKKKEPKKDATKCKGLRDSASELGRIIKEADKLYKQVQGVAEDVAGKAEADAQKLQDGEKARAESVGGKNFSCDTCEPLNACLKTGKTDIEAVVDGLEKELSSLEGASGGGEGEEDSAFAYDDALDAIDAETEVADEKFKKVFADFENTGSCTSGVKDEGAKSEFESFCKSEVGTQDTLYAGIQETWCKRHSCKTPDVQKLADRVSKFSDSVAVFSEDVGDVSAQLSEAEEALTEAAELLADPTGDESRNLFNGAKNFEEALGILDEAKSSLDGKAREACAAASKTPASGGEGEEGEEGGQQ